MAQIAEVYTAVTEALRQHAAAHRDAALTGSPVAAFSPPHWNGDTLAIAEMGDAFNREELYASFRNSVTAAGGGGTVGDIMSSVLQGDYVAALERAFRARHATPIRDAMHAAGRRRGHAHPFGVFTNGQTNFVKQIAKLGSG